MIEPILRLKLSDFLGTDFEKDVLSKLHDINNLDYYPPFPIYFPRSLKTSSNSPLKTQLVSSLSAT